MEIKKEASEINECPTCASLNIVFNQTRDQVVCKDCGVIFEPMIPLEGNAPILETAKKTPAKKKKASTKKKK